MIELTREGLREIFPRAPQAVIDAFVAKQDVLEKAGITHTRPRLSVAFAHVEHECGGFTIPNLTENINYTAERMAQVWPNRFPSASAVINKYGSAPGWQKKAFDDIYGNRMGNRPGTSDGSRFIGRGGPQITGRDGYREVGKRSGLGLEANPDLACQPFNQPEILAAFWSWKGMNRFADTGDFLGSTKAWNGGTNGLADRKAKMAGNAAIIARLPGAPPTPKPPKDVIDEATTKERNTRKGGVVVGGAGAGGEATKTGTQQADKPFLSPVITYTLIGVGVALVIVTTILIARKKATVVKNWF